MSFYDFEKLVEDYDYVAIVKKIKNPNANIAGMVFTTSRHISATVIFSSSGCASNTVDPCTDAVGVTIHTDSASVGGL